MTDRHTLFLYLIIALAAGNMLLTAVLVTPGTSTPTPPDPPAEHPAAPSIVPATPCPSARQIATAVVSALLPENEPADEDPIKKQVREMRQNIHTGFQHWREKARKLRQQRASQKDAP